MLSPTAFYVGLPRCGSTWLFDNLRQHPDVHVPAVKDLYFFDRHFDRGWDWYGRHFDSERPVRIEFSHDYLFSPTAARRIHELVPSPRIIIGVREPVDYLLSTLQNLRRNGISESTIDLIAESGRLVASASLDRFIEPWLERFPRGDIFIYRFDQLSADPTALYAEVLDHLDLADHEPSDVTRRVNAAAAPRSSLVARTSKSLAGAARRVGADGLVGRVKSSDAVRRALYRPATGLDGHHSLGDLADLRSSFQPSVVALAAMIDDATLVADWGYA